jgi:hypothetical protein
MQATVEDVEPGQRWILRLANSTTGETLAERTYTVRAVDGDYVVFEEHLTRMIRDSSSARHMLNSPQWQLEQEAK